LPRSAPPSSLPAIITGASAGIGADLARVFTRNGHPLALLARDVPRLEALARELAAPGGAQPLVLGLDLEAPDAPARLAAFLRTQDFEPGILVNNAGFGLLGPAAETDPGRQIAMIDLNVRALTALTLQFLPQIAARRGAIMNVASTASFFPGPGMAVYYASKAFVRSFSEALAHELRESGVRVSALCPGPTATEFFDRAGARNASLSTLAMMPSMRVAEAGYSGLMAGKRVVVPGLANRLLTTFAPLAPAALVLRAIARLQMSRR